MFLFTNKFNYFQVVFILILSIVHSQPNCILQKPIKPQCLKQVLKSITIDSLQSQMSAYMCIIISQNIQNLTLQPSQIQKISEICVKGSLITPQGGFRAIQLYILQKQFLKALQLEYQIFFRYPFSHQSNLINTLKKSQKILKQDISNQSPKLNQVVKLLYKQQYLQAFTLLSAITKQSITVEQQKYYNYIKLRLFQKLGRYTEALQTLQSVIKSGSSDFYIYHLYGNFLMHHIKFQKAIKAFEQSIKLKQIPFLFSHYNIALCYQKIGKFQESINYLSKALDYITQPCPQILNALGFGYYEYSKNIQNNTLKNENLKKAYKYYTLAIEANPSYMLALYNLGVINLQLGKKQQAKKYFKDTLAINPIFRSALFGLLKAQYNSKDKTKLLQILNQLKQLNNNQITAQMQLQQAIVLYQLGQLQIALQKIQQAAKKTKSQSLMQWKGLVSYSLNKLQIAQSAFTQSISLGGRKASVYFNLGLVKKQLKKNEQALKLFKLAYNLQKRQQTKQQIKQLQKTISSQL